MLLELAHLIILIASLTVAIIAGIFIPLHIQRQMHREPHRNSGEKQKTNNTRKRNPTNEFLPVIATVMGLLGAILITLALIKRHKRK